jgi:hypothetical protein
MKQYMYRAEWLCEPCAQREATTLGIELGKFDGDSDDGPVGPYVDQESDCPEHCGECGVFMRNNLTDPAGIDYVMEAISNHYASNGTDGNIKVINEWRNYYNL